MGLFGNKKKKQFSTTVQRMIDDDHIALSSKAAVTNYLFSTGMSSSTSIFGKGLPDYIVEAAQNAMPAKYNQAYRTARQGRYSSFGLPKAASVSRSEIDLPARVQSVIEAELGKPITLLYAEIGDANYYHFLWKLLIDQYGYNPTTNELETLSTTVGFTCYLTSAVIHYCQATIDNVEDMSFFDQWGLSTESGQTVDRSQDLNAPLVDYIIDPVAINDFAEITYEYEEVIADTTPPSYFKTNSFDGTVLKGIAEIGATVKVMDVADTTLATGIADVVGYCEITLPTAATDIYIRVIDTALNESTLEHIIAPYTDTTDFGVGDSPTETVIRREVIITPDFLAYISAVPDEDDDTVAVDEPDYIMAGYTYDNAGITEIAYLTYEYESNTRPELENLFTLTDAAGEFYPRLYARLNANNLSMFPKTDPAYKDSMRLGKVLGMDWKEYVKGLHKSIADGGGVSVNEIKQMFTMVGAPMNTSDPIVCEYLFRYFHKTYDELTTPVITDLDWGFDPFSIKEGVIMEVRDNVYTQYISIPYIGFERVTGVICPVGKYTSRFVTGFRAYHAYSYQDEEDSYLEVRVYSITMQHRFDGGGTTQNNRDEALIIPLDRTVIPRLNQNEKEILFAKCLYIFINVVKIIKIKWYQRGAFKVVMLIIAVVISIVTVGAGAPYAAYAYAALYAIAVSVAISIAIQLLVKVMVSLGVSSDIIAVVAVIAAIVAIVAGGSADFSALLNTSANTLIQVSNAAFQLAAGMQKYEMNEVVKQMDAFSKEATVKQDLLEKAKDLLETGTLPLSLEVMMSDLRSKVFINAGESADTFLSRTIGLSNIGTLGFEMVSNYVDSTLTLPAFNSTMALTQQRG